MTPIEDFERLAKEAARSRVRTSWLVSMFANQQHAIEFVAKVLERDGLEDLNQSLVHAARLHEPVAREIPILKLGRVVGTPNAKLLVAHALTLGLWRTDPDIDGILVTGARQLMASRILVDLVRAQTRFAPSMAPALDQGAALLSALDRADGAIRQFAAAAGGVPE